MKLVDIWGTWINPEKVICVTECASYYGQIDRSMTKVSLEHDCVFIVPLPIKEVIERLTA